MVLLTIALILMFSGLSAYICYRILRPRLWVVEELDQKTAESNAQIKEENIRLCLAFDTLTKQNEQLENENRIIDSRISEKRNTLALLEEQSK